MDKHEFATLFHEFNNWKLDLGDQREQILRDALSNPIEATKRLAALDGLITAATEVNYAMRAHQDELRQR